MSGTLEGEGEGEGGISNLSEVAWDAYQMRMRTMHMEALFGPDTPEGPQTPGADERVDWEEMMGWDTHRRRMGWDASTQDCASSSREDPEWDLDSNTPVGPAHYPSQWMESWVWDGQHQWEGDHTEFLLEHGTRHAVHSSAAIPTLIPMTCIVITSWGKQGILTEVVGGMHGCCGGENFWSETEGRYESLEECGTRVGLERLGLSGLTFGREIGTACTTTHLIIRHIGVTSYTDGGGISHTAIRPRERQTLRWLALSGVSTPASAFISDVMDHVWEDITRFYHAGH